VKAEGAVADQADLGVQAFEAAVAESAADGGEDAGRVEGEPNNGFSLSRERVGPRQPDVEELFAQQEGAVEPAVLGLDFGEGGELADRLPLGRLEQ
jgi:hypothetical protein